MLIQTELLEYALEASAYGGGHLTIVKGGTDPEVHSTSEGEGRRPAAP
jgi:hypothetical protein